jgi:hypothetical protein
MPGVRVKVFEAEQKAPSQAPQAPSEDDVETQNIPF